MPQELALYFSFRINELFFFYGKLNGMRNDDLLKQIDFIAELLHLPNGDRIIGTLSGGQKRLISFGASMMHDPRLLILDEPTVGVDPVLSAKIWRHLVYLSSNRGTTIIMTTHYIEEARQANRVGLMRAGKILCEGEPEALIEEKGAKNLEGVFLDLCRQDISPGSSQEKTENECDHRENDDEIELIHGEEEDPNKNESEPSKGNSKSGRLYLSSCGKIFNFTHLISCIIKDLILTLRDVPSLVFTLLLPFMQLCVVLITIGGNPRNLDIAVVNEDFAPKGSSYSQKYLQYLDAGDWADIKYYKSMKSVQNAVDKDEVAAVFHFLPGFTDAIVTKFETASKFSAENASRSSIQLTLDEGSPLIANLVVKKAESAYSKLENDLYSRYVPNQPLQVPVINITEPLFEDVDSFTDFAAPGTMAYLIFVSATFFSSTRVIGERKLGLLERLTISGVTGSSLTLSMLFVQSFILIMQVGILVMTTLVIFGTPLEGNLYLVLFIACLQGYTGMIFGILVSVICTEEAQVFQLVFGLMEMIYFLSGIAWPHESLPPALQTISSYLPLEKPAKALRFILLRGWDITFEDVQAGIYVNIIYFAGFLTFAILLRKVLHIKG
ncbi:ABC transporter G family member 23-like isoform X2 [Convolutriloba macropyga]